MNTLDMNIDISHINAKEVINNKEKLNMYRHFLRNQALKIDHGVGYLNGQLMPLELVYIARYLGYPINIKLTKEANKK